MAETREQLMNTKKFILVVDDEEGIREMLRLAFEMADYPVATAANGKLALDMLPEIKPGLIVLDLMMPVMDGKSFARALAQDPAWSAIPVVVITAFFGEVQGSVPGALILEKPLDLDVLLREAEKYCG